jgi:hypothetical protein
MKLIHVDNDVYTLLKDMGNPSEEANRILKEKFKEEDAKKYTVSSMLSGTHDKDLYYPGKPIKLVYRDIETLSVSVEYEDGTTIRIPDMDLEFYPDVKNLIRSYR